MTDGKLISFSQYKLWRECHYQWELKYIEKLSPFKDNIHNVFGTAMHEVIQTWLTDYVYGHPSKILASTVDLSDELKKRLVEIAAPVIKQLNENGEEYFIFSRNELEEFYQHGLEILRYLQKNVDKFFPTDNHVLFAIEYELSGPTENPNVKFRGFIDVVIHDTKKNEYHLYDLKTSTRGWNQWAKKDKKLTDQLLLYKYFFAEELGIDLKKIHIYFTILKRMVPDMDFPVPRISNFTPSHGKPSINKAMKGLNNFVRLAFTDEGDYINSQKPMPSDSACRFCPFSEDGTCDYSAKLGKNKKKQKQDDTEWVTLK